MPISSALVTRMYQTAGVDKILTFDIHSEQTIGFSTPQMPIENAKSQHLAVNEMFKVLTSELVTTPVVVVSPDAGGVKRAKNFQFWLNKKLKEDASLVTISKQRSKQETKSSSKKSSLSSGMSTVLTGIENMNVDGDVAGCHCIIVDDMIDSAGTLKAAAERLKELEAKCIWAFATHAVFSGKAYDNLSDSPLEKIWVTDSVPKRRPEPPKFHRISLASSIAEMLSEEENSCYR